MADVLDRCSPLWQLTLTRLREFIREPEALFWVFVFPILMALALGLAFRTGNEPVVIVGVGTSADTSPEVAALKGVGGIEVRAIDPDRIESALRNGEVQVLLIPGDPPTYRFDPTRAESRLARLALDAVLQRAAGRTDAFAAVEEPVVVRGSRYIDWLVPGLLGMNIMGSGVWSISFSVVLARSRALLKQLVATPMRRRQYLLAQILSRLLFLGFEVGTLLFFGWLVFDIAIRGSVLAIGVLSVVGAVAFCGLGLLIASRVRTIEAVSGLVNVALLPMWVLSGVFFAPSNFPEAMQPFIHALPLTALNDALRAVMLEGASLVQVGAELSVLGAWGIVSFVLALRLFSWR